MNLVRYTIMDAASMADHKQLEVDQLQFSYDVGFTCPNYILKKNSFY